MCLAFPVTWPIPGATRWSARCRPRSSGGRGLWTCHLGPELVGQGYGQVKLGLINEILGRSRCGPIVFGCQAPDFENAEILAHDGTSAQKYRYPVTEGDFRRLSRGLEEKGEEHARP